jgi:hypothetical protein
VKRTHRLIIVHLTPGRQVALLLFLAHCFLLPAYSDICSMQPTAATLQTIITEAKTELSKLEEQDASFKPTPSKWSKKELIGHLIDSAQNNIRRFITAQYEDKPTIIYNQDKWVELNGWQYFPLTYLVDLWYLLNQQICNILDNVDEESSKREARSEALHSIQWLAEDYLKHLKHHLHQVLELEPVAYP